MLFGVGILVMLFGVADAVIRARFGRRRMFAGRMTGAMTRQNHRLLEIGFGAQAQRHRIARLDVGRYSNGVRSRTLAMVSLVVPISLPICASDRSGW